MSNTDMGRLVSNSPRPHMIQQDPDTVLQWLQDVMKASDIHLYYGKIYDDYADKSLTTSHTTVFLATTKTPKQTRNGDA